MPARSATRHSQGPAVVRAAQVAAPLTMRALAVARYCTAPSDRLAPCRPGQRGVVAQPKRLLELGFTARLAAGSHSWYAWNVEAPHQCSQASGGGPTMGPVAAGTRLVFDVLLPPSCRGVVRAAAFYITQSPTADVERETLIGRRTIAVP